LEVILQVEAQVAGCVGRSDPPPGGVGLQLPGIGLVEEGRVQDPDEPLLDIGIVDGDDHLHPTIEVPLHQVGRTEADAHAAAAHSSEAEDPGVLEIATDDGAHRDVLRQPLHAGPETAQPADDEVDRHAGQ
jgi:hypothetical protein